MIGASLGAEAQVPVHIQAQIMLCVSITWRHVSSCTVKTLSQLIFWLKCIFIYWFITPVLFGCVASSQPSCSAQLSPSAQYLRVPSFPVQGCHGQSVNAIVLHDSCLILYRNSFVCGTTSNNVNSLKAAGDSEQ